VFPKPRRRFETMKDQKVDSVILKGKLDVIIALLRSIEINTRIRRVNVSKSLKASQRSKLDINPVETYVGERLALDEWLREYPPAVYKDYIGWCESSAFIRPLGKQHFYKQLLTNFRIRRMRPHDSTTYLFEGCQLRFP
jgi:hypothetical protein